MAQCVQGNVLIILARECEQFDDYLVALLFISFSKSSAPGGFCSEI
jgi:hypothetical protein